MSPGNSKSLFVVNYSIKSLRVRGLSRFILTWISVYYPDIFTPLLNLGYIHDTIDRFNWRDNETVLRGPGYAFCTLAGAIYTLGRSQGNMPTKLFLWIFFLRNWWASPRPWKSHGWTSGRLGLSFGRYFKVPRPYCYVHGFGIKEKANIDSAQQLMSQFEAIPTIFTAQHG